MRTPGLFLGRKKTPKWIYRFYIAQNSVYNYSIVLYCRYPIAYNFILRRKSLRYIALIVCLRLLLPSLSDQ